MIIEKVVKEKNFEPATISITFESLDDVRIMWGYLNVAHKTVEESNKQIPEIAKALGNSKLDHYAMYRLFCLVDDILQENCGNDESYLDKEEK